MEMELEPRVKTLQYKVKGVSRETPTQKSINVLDSDLRTCWSTGTNTKEWILLELHEPCLLSHLRIHNKSVLEWEVAAGLRYKPETFSKVRPRSEAPRRDMTYPMNYTPCRYVRLSCLRGSPIAIFFIELIGIPVPGLEPEFQLLVNYLLPQIIPHEQDSRGLHLQLLQDITTRLHTFLPQLETELNRSADDSESTVRFLAILAGPFYPILQVMTEREIARSSGITTDTEVSRNSQPSSAMTVSSNFEPRKSRSSSALHPHTSKSTAFRPDAIFMLLRKAYGNSHLGAVCRVVSRILHYLSEGTSVQEEAAVDSGGRSSASEEESVEKPPKCVDLSDYSELFGEEYALPVIDWDSSYVSILDVGAVEEGILHVLYACAYQPLLCSKFADSANDFWLALPLIQALLPALRPASGSADIVDDSFSQWNQPYVQQALSKIVSTLSSTVYRPLLHACAGYLSSFSPFHARTACFLIDLCSSVLVPWMPQVVAKIDLAVELLEDLLGVILGDRNSSIRARVAFKYIVLALSGFMDDVLSEYKGAKHRVLFLVEMLETFLAPAFRASPRMKGSGDMSDILAKDNSYTCAVALNVIRAAVKKPSILPSLELEWRSGSVPPSVLLSILDPHMQLPAEIDCCKSAISIPDTVNSAGSLGSDGHSGSSFKSSGQDDSDGATDVSARLDVLEDASLLFVPSELQKLSLADSSENVPDNIMQSSCFGPDFENKPIMSTQLTAQIPQGMGLDYGFFIKYLNLLADSAQLLDSEDRKLRASEFRRLAFDLHSQNASDMEGHNAVIDALLLSAECYINPFFMMPLEESSKLIDRLNLKRANLASDQKILELRRALGNRNCNLETIGHLERERDKVFVQILLEAAEIDRSFHCKGSERENGPYDIEGEEDIVNLSDSDMKSADAITLVRTNQNLLWNFVIQQLQREQHSLHETLVQSLLFLLHSATKLSCDPEHVVDIILSSAEHLNKLMTSLSQQCKERSPQLSSKEVYRAQRHWTILQNLVVASSGGGNKSKSASNVSGFQYVNLIPPSAWINRISVFSSSTFPLVRHLGWMAVSRNAKEYINQRLVLASDFKQVTLLLLIFSDDLAVMDCTMYTKNEEENFVRLQVKRDEIKQGKLSDPDEDKSRSAMYPDISMFLPKMEKEFKAFGESILEAVGLQLRSVPSTAIPDILSWFSSLCQSPFLWKMDKFSVQDRFPPIKGYLAKNAKAIILYILQAIISEHMEAVVPEMPRLVQVLESLCRSSYCDVSYLGSILCLLKPIISYSLSKVPDEEKSLNDDTLLSFESLCFDELFTYIREKNVPDHPGKMANGALVIFVLASVFPDLSFQHKREVIQSSLHWISFPTFEATTLFHDYLCAFQQLLDSCKSLLVENLRKFDMIPMPQSAEVNIRLAGSDGLKFEKWFPDDFCYNASKKPESDGDNHMLHKKAYDLSLKEIKEYSDDLKCVISKLNLTTEMCWKLHPRLSRNMTVSTAQCLMYSSCLSSITHEVSSVEASGVEKLFMCKSVDQFLAHWKIGLEDLATSMAGVLENNCWEVASTIIDCLLNVPAIISLDNVMGTLCSAVEHIVHSAPKIAWRLQSDRWLSNLFTRGVLLHESGISLVELVGKLLSHPEPELRFTALLHLARLMGLDIDDGWAIITSSFENLASRERIISVSESVLSNLVSNTWDQVAVIASSDASLHLRTLAKALLTHYVPHAERHKLQSFLETADTLLQSSGEYTHQISVGLFDQLSLALFAGILLYTPAEDISLVPQNVWRYFETLGMSKTGRLGDFEKKICQAMCRVKHEGDDAKQVLKEALSSYSEKEFDPDFGSTRESVLQVLANLSSVHSYFDIFAEKIERETMELQEAELEMDIIHKENPRREDIKGRDELQLVSSNTKDANRLQQIKDSIRSMERSKLQEEIIARRQKKLLFRRERQKCLEEAALREAELTQELDRHRMLEVEREIERQQLLELERAKTNELRFNLDLEKERQAQRELQREIEQVESGSRQPRREFSSTHSSRPRERYRDRESGRTSSSGMPPHHTSSSLTTTPTVVLSGSRAFSSQPPTILQSRDRSDECSSTYEENFDGGKDSGGDAGSTGDPEFDALSVGFSTQRHGTRGGKSRQIVERRERESRREGKWERKHS